MNKNIKDLIYILSICFIFLCSYGIYLICNGYDDGFYFLLLSFILNIAGFILTICSYLLECNKIQNIEYNVGIENIINNKDIISI